MQLTKTRRFRGTPFSAALKRAGGAAYTAYNRTLAALRFESLKCDDRHSKKRVPVWKTTCRRRIEMNGSDATGILRVATPGNVDRMLDGRCFCLPVADRIGGMLNGPVPMKFSGCSLRLSKIESAVDRWTEGIAVGAGIYSVVRELDVFPIAIQVPHSEPLMESVFGGRVAGMRFFQFEVSKFVARACLCPFPIGQDRADRKSISMGRRICA
ncbi:MAG: hypothetical protein OXI87_04490 [Albidovulum sp.]|nr:hypothetical protein [Albidovulum sp.]MDE0304134.1 hypothetical protein [Albidovulum sp.]